MVHRCGTDTSIRPRCMLRRWRRKRRCAACRELVARMVNAQPDSVYFTSGGTEANNLAILGSVAARRGPVRAVVSATEHPSVLAAFDELRACRHEVDVVPVDRAGQLDWDALDEALGKARRSSARCRSTTNRRGPGRAEADRAGARARARGADPRGRRAGLPAAALRHARRGLLHAVRSQAARAQGRRRAGGGSGRPVQAPAARRRAEKGLRSGTENTPGIAGLRRAVEEMRALGDVAGLLQAKKLRLWAAIRREAPQAVAFGPRA